MRKSHIAMLVLLTVLTFTMAACSHVGEDWKAAQTADTTEAYQDFLRQHPDSEYGVAAQERVRQLAEDRDWQQASKADTLDAYQQFVAVHADGKWAQEARVRIENFQLSAGGQSPPAVPGSEGAGSASPAVAPAATAAASPSKPKTTTKATTQTSPAAATAKASAKHYAQLGAYSSMSSAEAAWHQLSGRYPAQLKSLQPHYATAGSSTKPVVRLQVSVPSSQRAHDLCTELKKKSQACIPLS